MKIQGLPAQVPVSQETAKAPVLNPKLITPKNYYPLTTNHSLPPNFPADKLSAAIVSFAKFFSLPLEPGLLTKIRAAAMGQAHSGQAGGQANIGGEEWGAGGRAKEAFAFAALAAADKGLELSPPALAEYAAAIDPDARGNEGRQGANSQGRDSGQTDDDADDDSDEKDKVQEHKVLKRRVLQTAESSALLKLLNRLPGKNGQRWLVFPFSFAKKGRQFAASLKILLGSEAGQGGGKMTLDIAEQGAQGGAKGRRWLFTLDVDKRGKKRLAATLTPPRRDWGLKAFARRLSQFMEMPLQDVAVQNAASQTNSNFTLDSINLRI